MLQDSPGWNGRDRDLGDSLRAVGDPKLDADAAETGRTSEVVPRSYEKALYLAVQHRSYCVATYGPMTISLWDGAVRGERITKVIEESRRQCELNPRGGGLTILVEPHTGIPELHVRSTISEALREMSRFIHCAAVVVDGEGVIAQTARGVVNLLFLAARVPIPVKLFGNIDEAARWQAGLLRVEPKLGASELSRVYRDVRRHHAVFRSGR
jgi:hypothetical protein